MTAEELKNVAGFKAVDAEGNELGVVSLSDIVSAVKQELQPSGVARASVAALSEVSAQAATDTYEDQLPQKTDVTWIRGLDESGNPILISKQSLVSVAEGLIGVAKLNKKGLLDSNILSSLIYASPNAHQQYTIIKSANSDIYCSAIISFYHGGKNGLYSIVTISNKQYYIKNIADQSGNGLFKFYRNDNGDLIFRPTDTSASNRIRILILDHSNIDFSKCLTLNEEDISSMEKLTIY